MKRTGRSWKQRNGKYIKIRDMSDEHLKNTLRMLQRKLIHIAALANVERVALASMFSQRFDIEHQEPNRTWRDEASGLEIWSHLADEASHRNLKWEMDPKVVEKYQATYELHYLAEYIKAKEEAKREKIHHDLLTDKWPC